MGLPGLKSGLPSFRRRQGKIYLWHLQLPAATCIPSSVFKAGCVAIFKSLCPSWKDPCDCFGPTQILRDHPPISRSFPHLTVSSLAALIPPPAQLPGEPQTPSSMAIFREESAHLPHGQTSGDSGPCEWVGTGGALRVAEA